MKHRRWITLLLVLCMAVSLLPAGPAMAATTGSVTVSLTQGPEGEAVTVKGNALYVPGGDYAEQESCSVDSSEPILEGDTGCEVLCEAGPCLFYVAVTLSYDADTRTTGIAAASLGYCDRDTKVTVKADTAASVTFEDPSFTGERIGSWAELALALERGGEYVLESDVSPGDEDGALVVPEGVDVTLDLNSCSINRGLQEEQDEGSVLIVRGGLTLTGVGTVTGGYNSGNGGGAVVDQGELIIEDGVEVSGNNAAHGAGVYVLDGVLRLQGGSIRDNEASGKGGGVYVKSGEFDMDGGAIAVNYAQKGSSAVHVLENGVFRMNGGYITENYCPYAGQHAVYPVLQSEFCLSGRPVIQDNFGGEEGAECNVFVQSGYLISIGDEGLDSGAVVGVTLKETPGSQGAVFTSGLGAQEGAETGFVSDDEEYYVSQLDGEAALFPYAPNTVDVDYDPDLVTVHLMVDGAETDDFEAGPGSTVTVRAEAIDGDVTRVTGISYDYTNGDGHGETDGDEITFVMPNCPVYVMVEQAQLHEVTARIERPDSHNDWSDCTLVPDKDRAIAGETVTLHAQLRPGVALVSALNDAECYIEINYEPYYDSQKVDDTTITFVMPDEDAAVTAYIDTAEYTVSEGGEASDDLRFLRNDLPVDPPFQAEYDDYITVMFWPSGNQLIESMTYTYTEGGKAVTESIPFAWDDGQVQMVGYFRMPASDVEVRADYKEPWRITEGDMDGGVFASSVTIAVPGDTVYLYAAPDERYDFVEWHVINDSTGQEIETSTPDSSDPDHSVSFTMPDSDVTFRADFEQVIFDLTVDPRSYEHGTVEIRYVDGRVGDGWARKGAEVLVEVTADEGYRCTVLHNDDGDTIDEYTSDDRTVTFLFNMTDTDLSIWPEYETGSEWRDLAALLRAGGEVRLEYDYESYPGDSPLLVTEPGTVLDLNGHFINCSGAAAEAVDVVEVTGGLEIRGNGTILSQPAIPQSLVHVREGGSLKIDGAVLEGWSCTYVIYAEGDVTLESGTVLSRGARVAVYVDDLGSFTVNDGTVEGDAQKQMIAADGPLNISSGTVEGEAPDTVLAKDTVVTMTGGSVAGDTDFNNGWAMYLRRSVLRLSGDVEIRSTKNDDRGIYVGSGSSIYVEGEVSTPSPIKVHADNQGVFACRGVYGQPLSDEVVFTQQGLAGLFSSGNVSYEIRPVPGAANQAELYVNEDWDDLMRQMRSGGVINLDKDYTASHLKDRLTVPAGKTVFLDLNGHTIDGRDLSDNGVIMVYGTLYIEDTSDTCGSILGHRDDYTVYVAANGSLFMEGGAVISTDALFSAVCVKGVFAMDGGSVSAVADGTQTQSAVLVWGGTFNMTGGEITGEDLSTGAVQLYNKGRFNVSGAPSVDKVKGVSVYLYKGMYVGIAGALDEGVSLGVTAQDTQSAVAKGVSPAEGDQPYVITADDAGRVVSDNTVYETSLDTDSNALFLARTSNEWNDLKALLTAGGTVTLDKDYTAAAPDDTLTLPAGVETVLDLNGHTVDASAMSAGTAFVINGSLTVTDSAGGGTVRLDGKEIGVQVNVGGNLIINGGTVTGENVRNEVLRVYGRAEVNGGSVYCGATTSNSANVLFLSSSSGSSDTAFTMTGGSLSGSDIDCVIYATYGDITLTGGEITGSGLDFSAVLARNREGSFNISGSPVVTGDAGGGLFLYDGVVLTVTDGLSEDASIGVSMETPGTFTSGLGGRGGAENFISEYEGLLVLIDPQTGEAMLGEGHTVIFETADGSGEMAPVAVEDGGEYVLPECSFRPPVGKRFAAWSVASGQGDPVEMQPDDPITVTGDVVVTPVWEDLTEPAFRTQSLVLSGQIGVNFFVDLSMLTQEQLESCYVMFTVSGKNGGEQKARFDPSWKNETGDYYGFRCLVNSVQMADRIEAVLYYTVDGQELTVSKTYTVQEYLDTFTQKDGAEIFALVKAINDYGYHAQRFLAQYARVPWELGVDHAAMDKAYTARYSFSEEELNTLAGYEMLSMDVNGDGRITDVKFNLTLDTDTAVNLYLTPKEGHGEGLSAQTFEGADLECVKTSDGRYRVTVGGIPAHELGKTYKVIVYENGDPIHRVNVSVLSYVYACAGDGELAENAMGAIYDYYLKAEAYRQFLAAQNG